MITRTEENESVKKSKKKVGEIASNLNSMHSENIAYSL